MSLEKDKLFHLRRKRALSTYGDVKSGAKRLRGRQEVSGDRRSVLRFFAWIYGGVVVAMAATLVYVINDKNVDGANQQLSDDLTAPYEEYASETPPEGMPGTPFETEENVTLEVAPSAGDAHVPPPVEDVGAGKKVVPIDNIPDAAILPDPATTGPVGAETRPAWRKYAAAEVNGSRPKLVIVIDDLGLSSEASRRLSRMKGPLTLAYLPYGENLAYQTRLVRAAGHELMVHLPMEAQRGGFMDAGPNALLTTLSAAELTRRIDWNLSRFGEFVGINNHMGSRFTENPAGMMAVMNALKGRDMLFLDSITTPNSVGVKTARTLGVPYAARDIFLDNDRVYEKILMQLKKAERVATRRGYAIAIGHPYPVTLDVLSDWMARDAANPVTLAPLSQIVGMLDNRRRNALADNSGAVDTAR